MWNLVIDAADRRREQEDRDRLAEIERLGIILEDAQRIRAAREVWLKANTCPHCGQHPPLPPSLQ